MLPLIQRAKTTFSLFINVNSNKSRQHGSQRIPCADLCRINASWCCSEQARCPAVANGRHEVQRERGTLVMYASGYHAAATDTEHLHSSTPSPSAQILTTGQPTFSGSGCREGGEFMASHITKAVIHTGCSSTDGPIIANSKLLPRCSWEKVAWSHTIWCSVWQAAAPQENWSLKGRISSIGLINASVI